MKLGRALPWLLFLPALVFLTPLSPIVGDPYPHLAGTGWAALLLVPLALVVGLEGRAESRLAGPFLAALGWALLSRALVPLADTFEARRALLGLALVPLVLAGGAALDARGRALLEGLCVLASALWTGTALALGPASGHLAGVLGDTGSLSQAALPGAAIGATWLAEARGARRAAGALAFALFLGHVATAPVLAGAHALLAGLLLALFLGRGPGRGALAALAASALLAPFAGMALREAVTGTAPAEIEGASASPSHSLGGLAVRGRIWVAALGLVREHPVLGAGPGQFQAAFPPHRDPREIELSRHGPCSELDTEVEHAHNDWLLAACELGLPGGLLFALGLALVGREALRALTGGERRATAVAVLSLLVNAGVHAPLSANPASAVLAFALFGAVNQLRRPVRRSTALLASLPALCGACFALPLVRLGLALGDLTAANRDAERALARPLEGDGAGTGRAEATAWLGPAQAAAIAAARSAAADAAPARFLAARLEPWSPERVDDALEVRPHSAEAWERRATLQARRGLTAEARASYARALELSPTHPRILRNLARLEWIQGDLDSGRAALERLRAGGCLSEPWLRSVGVELVLVLGRVERGARLLFDRPLSALSPDELHARARGPAEPPATELAPHAQHLRSAEECLAQLLWARQHAAAGDYASAARSYRQAAAQSLAVRGREPGPAAALLLEQAAAEARAGREPEARALLARARGSAEDAELPPWAREALAGLGWPGPP